MDFKFSYDFMNNIKESDIYIANPNQKIIGKLNSFKSNSADFYFNNISKLNFVYYKYIDNIENSNYDYIENNMTILLKNKSCECWFQITSCNETNDGINPYKTVECSSLENEFTTKRLTSFGQLGTETDDDGGLCLYKLCDYTNTDRSIMHIVLSKLPSWSIGTIDNNISDGYRSFTDDDIDAYSFLTESVANAYDCIFLFNTVNKTISAYSLDTLQNDTGIILSYKNLINKVEFKSNASDIKTRLSVYGGDDCGNGNLNINEVNGTGNSTIENLDYYIGFMSDSLQNDYARYKTALTNSTNSLDEELVNLNSLYSQLSTLMYKQPESDDNEDNYTNCGIVYLENLSSSYLTIMSESLTTSSIYSTYKAKYDLVQTELTNKKNQLNTINNQITNEISICNSLVVNIEDYLTDDEIKELSRLYSDDTYTDSSFIATDIMSNDEIINMKIALRNLAIKKLNSISKPQYELKIDLDNYNLIKDYIDIAKKISLGDILTIDYDEKGKGNCYVKSRLLQLHIDFIDVDNFEMTFSNKDNLDGKFVLDELQSQAQSTASSQSIGSSSWQSIKNNNNTVRNFISSALDASKNRIINSEKQTVDFGSYGIRVRKYLDSNSNTYDDKQIWIANGNICFSDDGFNTVRMALGEIDINGDTVYGIVADALVGKMIIGESLTIENSDASMIFNTNGLSISNDTKKVTINPNDDELFKITIDDTDIMYIDDNTLNFSGNIVGGSININNKFLVDSDGNVTLPSNTTITWSQISNQPYIPTLPSYITQTKITSTTIESPTISAGTINGVNINGSLFKSLYVNGSDTIELTMGDVTFGIDVYLDGATSPSCAMYIDHSKISFYSSTKESYFGRDEILFSVSGSEIFKVNSSGVTLTTVNGGVPITSSNKSNYSFTPETHYQYSTTINPVLTSAGNVGLNGKNVASVTWCNETFEPLTSSDMRLKYDIQSMDINTAKSLIMGLKTRLFRFKDTTENNKLHSGILAQELISLMESLNISVDDSSLINKYISRKYKDESMYGKELYRVNYVELLMYIIPLLQDIYNQLDELKK